MSSMKLRMIPFNIVEGKKYKQMARTHGAALEQVVGTVSVLTQFAATGNSCLHTSLDAVIKSTKLGVHKARQPGARDEGCIARGWVNEEIGSCRVNACW